MSFSTWTDFLKSTEPYDLRVQKVRNSKLVFKSPDQQRQMVWVKLVPLDFAEEIFTKYNEIKGLQKLPISQNTLMQIQTDSRNTFNGNLRGIDIENRVERLVRLLNLQLYSYPELGYQIGLNYVAAVIQSVFKQEADQFIVLNHLLQSIFPRGYFCNTDRQIVKHTELRTFAIMARNTRPELVRLMTDNNNPDNDAFICNMKGIADVWLSTLFSSTIQLSELLRIWDCIFVFGWDIAFKIGLCVLSKNEKYYRNALKQELNSLKLGTTQDTIISSANQARAKLMQRCNKVGIEKLIKKALKKQLYVQLNYESFREQSAQLENQFYIRILNLQETKQLIKSNTEQLKTSTIEHWMKWIDSVSNETTIQRDQLIRSAKLLGWNPGLALKVYNCFDQVGNQLVYKLELKIGIILLSDLTLDEKLILCFKAFDQNNSGFLDQDEVIDMINMIESALDGRLLFFRDSSSTLFQTMDVNSDGQISTQEFVQGVKKLQSCKPILEYLKMLDENSMQEATQDTFKLFQEEEIVQEPEVQETKEEHYSEQSYQQASFQSEIEDEIAVFEEEEEIPQSNINKRNCYRGCSKECKIF